MLAVLSAERVMVADPRTGATRQRRIPGGTFCHGPLHVIGDRVVLSAERDRRPIALSLPLTLTGPGRSLGPAETFTASGTPDRAWISHWERSRVWRADERVLGSLREVDAEGRVVARTTLRMPAWGSLEAVVDGAFLLSHEGRISLRRPGAATRAVRDDWVVAAGTSRIASCRGDCRRLRIWVAWSGGRPLRLPIETGGTVMSIAPTPLRPAAFPSARAR